MKFGFPVHSILLAALMCPALFAAPPRDSQKSGDDRPGRRVRLGGIMVNAGYYSGPGWYPYGYGYPGFYPGWGRSYIYDPFWYNPYIHPGLYSGFAYQPNMGEVKLKSPDKTASVYLDGAYAGPADKLKSLWLEPGVYNLEVRDTGGQRYERRIYVLTGKTLQIQAKLEPARETTK
jgi:hypothetical protein